MRQAIQALTCILTQVFIYARDPIHDQDNDEEFAEMNRDELLASALGLIAKGDDAHPPMATACYLGAIAKLLLAQALPLSAYERDLAACDAAASPLRITDQSEWLPGDPV